MTENINGYHSLGVMLGSIRSDRATVWFPGSFLNQQDAPLNLATMAAIATRVPFVKFESVSPIAPAVLADDAELLVLIETRLGLNRTGLNYTAEWAAYLRKLKKRPRSIVIVAGPGQVSAEEISAACSGDSAIRFVHNQQMKQEQWDEHRRTRLEIGFAQIAQQLGLSDGGQRNRDWIPQCRKLGPQFIEQIVTALASSVPAASVQSGAEYSDSGPARSAGFVATAQSARWAVNVHRNMLRSECGKSALSHADYLGSEQAIRLLYSLAGSGRNGTLLVHLRDDPRFLLLAGTALTRRAGKQTALDGLTPEKPWKMIPREQLLPQTRRGIPTDAVQSLMLARDAILALG